MVAIAAALVLAAFLVYVLVTTTSPTSLSGSFNYSEMLPCGMNVTHTLVLPQSTGEYVVWNAEVNSTTAQVFLWVTAANGTSTVHRWLTSGARYFGGVGGVSSSWTFAFDAAGCGVAANGTPLEAPFGFWGLYGPNPIPPPSPSNVPR